MSLASDYAAAQVVAAADQVAANQSIPPSFTGPNGSLTVTAEGNLSIVPTSAGSNLTLPPAVALAAAAWINATFGP